MDLSEQERKYMKPVTLRFKDKEMAQTFFEYRKNTQMYWVLYVTFWGTIHQTWQFIIEFEPSIQ